MEKSKVLAAEGRGQIAIVAVLWLEGKGELALVVSLSEKGSLGYHFDKCDGYLNLPNVITHIVEETLRMWATYSYL